MVVVSNTPTLRVLSNNNFLLRQVDYYCREAEEELKPFIQLQGYDRRGQLSRLVDARFSEVYLQNPKTTKPNYKQLTSLSGLYSESGDAGMRFMLSDVGGKELYGIDSRETEQRYDYDEVGRLISRYETKGKENRCTERFAYGGKEAKRMNGVNRLLKHFDTAGLEEIINYNLQGQVVKQSRKFLKAERVDWSELDLSNLEKASYETSWAYNSVGELTEQRDAQENIRYSHYAVSGQLQSSALQLKDKEKQTVVGGMRYAANGQLLQKEYRDKESVSIRVHYRYEDRTQRLSGIESVRLSDNKKLQDLSYAYDPVGNILEVRDKSKGIGFYANGKTESVSHYRYDSLYQLIEASGIESQLAGKEMSVLPSVIPLGNRDASRCVNYTRRYEYDAGGNLLEMQHQGVRQYTQRIEIDAKSNRGLEEGSKRTLKQSFDGNGNLLYLNTRPLAWDARNQLSEVNQVVREKGSDKESYRYAGSGQRVEKLTQRLAENQVHTERVRYLPGIELRERWQTDLTGKNKQVNEVLHVIHTQEGRVLHWEMGKPEEIANDSLRFTLTDQLDSIQLELNSEGKIISYESYYPYGGTAIWSTKNQSEVNYKFIRYSGKEKDSTGLYYYGYRYYAPWLGRWLNPDPSGIEQGLNFYQMVRNNPILFIDTDGKAPKTAKFLALYPLQIDAESGTNYHHIRSVEFQRGGQTVSANIDIKAYRIGPNLNKDFYLFQGSEEAERLVVSAHGAYSLTSPSVTNLKEDGPMITFLGPHNYLLGSEDGDSLLKTVSRPYASISYENITITSQQAYENFSSKFPYSRAYKHITGASEPRAIRNYMLSKFETTESAIYNHPLEGVAYDVYRSSTSSRGGGGFDVLTLRKNANISTAFEDIMTLANALEYTEVIFNFCRFTCPERQIGMALIGTDPDLRKNAENVLEWRTYAGGSTKLLSQSISVPWETMDRSDIKFGRQNWVTFNE